MYCHMIKKTRQTVTKLSLSNWWSNLSNLQKPTNNQIYRSGQQNEHYFTQGQSNQKNSTRHSGGIRIFVKHHNKLGLKLV